MNLETRLEDRPEFVTGTDGFVGSHLVDQLVALGTNVHTFVRAIPSGELNNIPHQHNDITVHRRDLRDKHSAWTALESLQGHGDSIIFHLGAQAYVGESWDRPYETVDTNITGTLNLLQSIVDLDLDITKFDTAGLAKNSGMLMKRWIRNTSLQTVVEPSSLNGHPLIQRVSMRLRNWPLTS